MIAIGWNGAVPATVVEDAVKEVGLASLATFTDDEVRSGFQECKEALGIEKFICLVESKSDSTSNKVTSRISKEIGNDLEPCICQLAANLQNKIDNGQVWFFFAFDWPVGIEVTYLEGPSRDLECYMRLNGGAFRLLYSIKSKRHNLDLDTPLVWKLGNKRRIHK